MTEAQVETKQFQAETRKVLDIVINSLYTERDIFVRELVSLDVVFPPESEVQ